VTHLQLASGRFGEFILSGAEVLSVREKRLARENNVMPELLLGLLSRKRFATVRRISNDAAGIIRKDTERDFLQYSTTT
jgi:hypothetical protein